MDVYSFGIVIWEIETSSIPFVEYKEFQETKIIDFNQESSEISFTKASTAGLVEEMTINKLKEMQKEKKEKKKSFFKNLASSFLNLFKNKEEKKKISQSDSSLLKNNSFVDSSSSSSSYDEKSNLNSSSDSSQITLDNSDQDFSDKDVVKIVIWKNNARDIIESISG